MNTKKKLRTNGGYLFNGLFIPDSAIQDEAATRLLAEEMIRACANSPDDAEGFTRHLNKYYGISGEEGEVIVELMKRLLSDDK